MKFSLLAFGLLATQAAAFAPSHRATFSPAATALSASRSQNGWSPDDTKVAYGLPGALPPFEDGFDPLGLSQTTLENIKYYREAETQHGRVAMLAVLGFLITENPINFHPLFALQAKTLGPAIYHLDEVRAVAPPFFTLLTAFIAFAELNRALKGWEAPQDEPWALKDDYFPGDIGFDPLGLKPDDPDEFYKLSTKELQNGRLAMLASMGFIAQELVSGKQIIPNLVPTAVYDYAEYPVMNTP